MDLMEVVTGRSMPTSRRFVWPRVRVPTEIRVQELARPVAVLNPDDTLGMALHRLRATLERVLPVVSGERLVGILAEADLVRAWESGHLPVRVGGSLLDDWTVERVMTRVVTACPPETSVASAWETMASGGLKLLPVITSGGRLEGVVSRHDLLAALHGELRPAEVGGLATPLGVYLTTGDLRAGPGDAGLFLTGATLGLAHGVAASVLAGVAARWPGLLDGAWTGLLTFLAYLVLVRMTPLARIHAAEHQVVHVIEQGAPLTREHVARAPRIHPRCGTNLTALLLGAQGLLPLMAHPVLAACLALLMVWAWRPMGRAVQRHFTTRPPGRRHLESARRVAQDLLERHAACPAYRAPLWKRLWHAGFIQMFAGFAAILAVVRSWGLPPF
jgi:CBS domain-containing protein